MAGHAEQPHVRRVERPRAAHALAIKMVELERHVARAALLAARAALADDRGAEPALAVPVAHRLRRVLAGAPGIQALERCSAQRQPPATSTPTSPQPGSQQSRVESRPISATALVRDYDEPRQRVRVPKQITKIRRGVRVDLPPVLA